MLKSTAEGNATKDFLAMYNPKSAKKLNDLMSKMIPEMAQSKYGAFPMKNVKWLGLDETSEDSQQVGFIPYDGEVKYREDANYNEDIPIKKDYVFGQGARGFGYYHLLTREAYANLNTRLAIAKTPRHNVLTWLRGHAGEVQSEQEREEMYDILALMYHRSHSKEGPGEHTWDPQHATKQINELMQKYIPEIDSVGLYPMKMEKWSSVDGNTPDDAPAFVKYEGPEVEYRSDNLYVDVPIKKDYIFGTGQKGWGYYHLTTRQSYEILNQRVVFSKLPRHDLTVWLEGHGSRMTTPPAKEELDKLAALLYRRSHELAGPNEKEDN